MNKRDIVINHLPAYTYNWLHMNHADLADVDCAGSANVQAEVPEGVAAGSILPDGTVQTTIEQPGVQLHDEIPQILTGAGADMDALVMDSGAAVRVFCAPEGVKVPDALRLSFVYDHQTEGRVNAYRYVLDPDAEMTVVMDYTADRDASGFAAVQTKIHAKAGSVLRLVQIQRLGDAYTLINDIGGVCEEGARIELIRLILSGKNTYDGCRVALEGEKSALNVDLAYLAAGDAHLDMNYDAYHTGRNTTSEMNFSGVLRDRAFKLFRGTIDFQTGCSGAVGNELEDVLLMDNDVSNQTIPLILCAEEDVVGNHGATIGRLDDQLLFYMESRGMNREEIYEMMARARIDAVIRKIPDERTREMLLGESVE